MIDRERWYKFNLSEQIGHIGGEITRARMWEDKNDRMARNRALERALDLIDMTKDDIKLRQRLKELCYLRELVADKYIDASDYEVSLKDLEEYCFDFALVANKNR